MVWPNVSSSISLIMRAGCRAEKVTCVCTDKETAGQLRFLLSCTCNAKIQPPTLKCVANWKQMKVSTGLKSQKESYQTWELCNRAHWWSEVISSPLISERTKLPGECSAVEMTVTAYHLKVMWSGGTAGICGHLVQCWIKHTSASSPRHESSLRHFLH